MHLDAGNHYQPCQRELARQSMTGQIAEYGLSAANPGVPAMGC
jgi:hypothetical protein